MKQPDFIKEFSKKNSQEERDALAKEIKNKRSQYFDIKNLKQQKLHNVQKEKGESELKLEEIKKRIEDTKNKLEEIQANLPNKIKNLFEYAKLSYSLKKETKNQNDLENEDDAFGDQIQKILNDLEKLDLSKSMLEAKNSIENFYKKQKQRWEQEPFSVEDVKKYFNSEYLSGLTFEEYKLLLKRFPNQMLTHVTRQGVRDHLGAVNHWAGVNEFWDGFEKILKQKSLINYITRQVIENEKENQIADFLNLSNITKEEAIAMIDQLCGDESQGHTGSLTDRTTTHFVTEEVADAHYGAETGNEIFFVYPSLLIGSEFVYRGQISKKEGGYHNDQWVFLDKTGLPLDAGIVFIPKDVPVDVNTGSKYELTQSKEPIKDAERIQRLETIVLSEKFKEFAIKYSEILGKTHLNFSIIEKSDDELSKEDKNLKEIFLKAKQYLEDNFSVTDDLEQEAIFEYNFLKTIAHSSDLDYIKSAILSRCIDVGIQFKLAQKTISSKQYWEKYFNDHGYTPSKIVYYESGDPTQAFNEWRKENGLNNLNNSVDDITHKNKIDLEDPHQISQKLPHINRFKSLAYKIIDDFYKN